MSDWLVWLIELFRHYDLILLALLIILQNNGIPVPANFLVIASGALAFVEGSSIYTLGLQVWLFSFLGDSISFWIWRKIGPLIITKFPWLGRRIERKMVSIENYFTRYGSATVMITRFPLSALGPFVNISAGASNFRYSIFGAWVLAGESLWTLFNVGVGYTFGDSFDEVLPIVTQFDYLIFLLAALIFLGYLLLRSYRRNQNNPEPTIRRKPRY